MRADMAKVIVERPRFGSRARGKGKGYKRKLSRIAPEDQPRREGMKRQGGKTKSLNEHLNPLGRYLEGQVGRPWNDVFAEICAHIDRNSAVQDHVRDHVWDFVTTEVILIDGVPHHKPGAGDRPWRKGPLEARGRWGGFYVCPVSGILKRVKRKWSRRTPEKPAPSYRLGPLEEVRRIKRQWFLVQLRVVEVPRPPWDHRPPEVRYEDVSRRPLSKRELMQLPVPVDLWRK
jgi:hypothetical protein